MMVGIFTRVFCFSLVFGGVWIYYRASKINSLTDPTVPNKEPEQLWTQPICDFFSRMISFNITNSSHPYHYAILQAEHQVEGTPNTAGLYSDCIFPGLKIGLYIDQGDTRQRFTQCQIAFSAFWPNKRCVINPFLYRNNQLKATIGPECDSEDDKIHAKFPLVVECSFHWITQGS